MYENDTGYPTSELISRLYTGAFLPYNFSPKYLNSETDEEKIDLFFSIGNFNNAIYSVQNGFLNRFNLIAELKFPDHFKRAIENPTEKTKKAADQYPTWFKMCCHLKFLLPEKGLDYFKLFSKLSEKYDEKECEKLFNNCSPTFGSIPGIFSIIDKYTPPNPNLNRRGLIKNNF